MRSLRFGAIFRYHRNLELVLVAQSECVSDTSSAIEPATIPIVSNGASNISLKKKIKVIRFGRVTKGSSFLASEGKLTSLPHHCRSSRPL